MKNIRLAFAFILAIASAAPAARADKLEQTILGNFYAPEQIKKYADLLNLTDDQKTTLRTAYENAQQRVEGLKQQLETETEKLGELTKPRHIDEKAATDQGEKLLTLDREIKHTQFALLIAIKNNLTPEQQNTLGTIKALDPKIKEAEKLVEKWKADGRDLTKLGDMKAEFDADLASGKVKEAETLVDRALDILNDRPAQ